MPAAIEIQNLTKDYEVGFWRKRKVRALDGLSLSVEPGQIFGFLGANGAGKTTTLKLLMGLIYPTCGTARILGRDIGDISMHARIGYLPENPYFYDYLTAREFLNYCAQLFGQDRSARGRCTEEILARVNLEKKSWDRQLRKFSKGMLQRVGLAQALVNDPLIVFLDEPMSGLDPVGRREVRDLIASLRAQGKTVFMCSHILSDIEVLCDNVAILKAGRLAHAGSLDELRARESALIPVVALGHAFQPYSDKHRLVGFECAKFRVGKNDDRSFFDRLALVIDHRGVNFQSCDRTTGKVARRRVQRHHDVTQSTW